MITTLIARGVAAVSAAALLVSCGGEAQDGAKAADRATPTATASEEPEPLQTETSTPDATPAVMIGEPYSITIPDIAVSARVVPVGLNSDGSMETPDYHQNEAGWYEKGPRPGAPGPAVVVAHVDGPEGPDVFQDLEDLDPGDSISVSEEAGETYMFEVTRTDTADKDELPYDEIWPETDDTLLTLITCHGEYDGEEYVDNYIVYAEEQ